MLNHSFEVSRNGKEAKGNQYVLYFMIISIYCYFFLLFFAKFEVGTKHILTILGVPRQVH